MKNSPKENKYTHTYCNSQSVRIGWLNLKRSLVDRSNLFDSGTYFWHGKEFKTIDDTLFYCLKQCILTGLWSALDTIN